jgi:hypothetical protein
MTSINFYIVTFALTFLLTLLLLSKTFTIEEMEPKIGWNPFCNFSVKGRNFFAHDAPSLYTRMPHFYSKVKQLIEDKKNSKAKPLNPQDDTIL